MVKTSEVLVIIPARGGSKGIPGKNIRDFSGAPLIAYSIAAAKKAELVTRVIVSTDDEKIAAVAREHGAETPFLRPAELAQDRSTDLPVFQHALTWLKENEAYQPNVVVQLRPTSPIRPKDCVDNAVRILLDHPEADCVRGVVPSGQNPHKMWRINESSGQMQQLLHVEGIKEPYNAPRQILPQIYWQTGHIDAIRPRAILEKESMTGDVIMPLLIDPQYTVDLDNLWDWEKAEWLLNSGSVDPVRPDSKKRSLPEKVSLIIFDFDGVLTDNRVWVDENGREMVAAHKGDSMGMNRLRKTGVECMVLSKETNSVVEARCKKLNLPFIQGIDNKPDVIEGLLFDKKLDANEVIYVGNDINDIPCFSVVGCSVVPVDAEQEAREAADIVLSRAGGFGAVREICDLIYQRKTK